MTIINPNSIAGITSLTAEADVMNFYRSNGALAGLQLNGVNFNTTNGISTFNNLTVGGTLTYEDVKNVDSVGIISARTAIHVGAGISAVGIITATSFSGDGSALTGMASTEFVHAQTLAVAGVSTFVGDTTWDSSAGTAYDMQWTSSNGQLRIKDSGKLVFGSSGDVSVYHDDTNFTLWNTKGNTYIQNTGDVYIRTNNTETSIKAIQNGGVELYYDTNRKFQTTNTGVEVTGGIKLNQSQSTINLDTSDGSDNKFLSIHGGGAASQSRGAGITFYGNEVGSHEGKLQILAGNSGSANGVIQMYTAGVERLHIASDGKITTKQSSTNTNSANWNGANLYIQNTSDTDNNTSNLTFANSAGNNDSGIQGIHVDAAGSGSSRRGYLQFGTSGANSSGSVVERMRISTEGLVGINTASPQGTLDVRGSVFVTDHNNGINFSHPTSNAEYHTLYLSSSDNSLRLKTAGGAWKDSITVKPNGPIGIGTDTPGTRDINGSLDIIQDHANNGPHFRVLNKHGTYGGGVQFKNNNAMGGIEFLNASGNNVLGIYNTTGGWHWGSTLNIPHGNYLRIGKNTGTYLLDVDSQSSVDGHVMAAFNGAESSNHAGLLIAHYLCGSDDNRTGLYWEHQNVSNERMWMGDDKRLYLKNSNPTESTAQGRYLLTVAKGVTDFPDGQSYDNAAKSAVEIKKYYPASQSGNYWIFDHNNVPRQIYCDMEIDGGGWMLWNDYNTSATSMNEALGGSSTSPHSGLSRGNWGNYAYYQVLIRASDIDSTGERLHSIVQLDGSGALKYCADYGCDFFLEDVGDEFQPNISSYFNAATSEYIQMDRAYQPQLGASGWQTFSGGGWQSVYIREMDSRMSPGMHRSCHLVERIYGFDDNGVPRWEQADSMSCLPYWTDISLGGEVADGTNDFMQEHGRKIVANNGNNGNFAQGRMHGVLTGQFEVEVKLGYGWGWSQAIATSTMQIAENLRDASGAPYNIGLNHYYYAGIYNNSSNNYWMPVVNSPYTGYTEFQRSGGAGTSISSYIWRTSDGTISCRRSDNTHGTINLGVPYAGPLIITSGRQSPMMTEIVGVWDAKRGDQTGNRDRWYK